MPLTGPPSVELDTSGNYARYRGKGICSTGNKTLPDLNRTQGVGHIPKKNTKEIGKKNTKEIGMLRVVKNLLSIIPSRKNDAQLIWVKV